MNNLKSEFIYRMFGSIIGAFCREFGGEAMRKMIVFLADDEQFWKLQEALVKWEPSDGKAPHERGAHDFIEKGKPNA